MKPSKADIFAAAIAKHKSVISDFTKRIKDLMVTDGNVNEQEYDNSSQAILAAQSTEVDMLTKELHFAQDELRQLHKMQETIMDCTIVCPGAVVQTHSENFFVSASIEAFKVGGVDYFGISVESPIYKAMKGKRAGDSFMVGTRAYKIAGIY